MATRRAFGMRHAAIGARMHSGWRALVAVSNDAGSIEIIERRRIIITTPGTSGGNQPYHFARSLELPDAEKFLPERFVTSKDLALTAVRDLADELRERQYHVVG